MHVERKMVPIKHFGCSWKSVVIMACPLKIKKCRTPLFISSCSSTPPPAPPIEELDVRNEPPLEELEIPNPGTNLVGSGMTYTTVSVLSIISISLWFSMCLEVLMTGGNLWHYGGVCEQFCAIFYTAEEELTHFPFPMMIWTTKASTSSWSRTRRYRVKWESIPRYFNCCVKAKKWCSQKC